jgi:SAM-dependent methyltransferase
MQDVRVSHSGHQFPDWHAIYRDGDPSRMPWYFASLDPDLAQALSMHEIRGGHALDLGTGPATQAFALADSGFLVTGSDLSEAAITRARAQVTAEQADRLRFVQDDILKSRLEGPFDFIFDRGCFHCLPEAEHPTYVSTLSRLLKPAGFLFLKTFSHLEPGDYGPYRYTSEQIHQIFATGFNVVSVAHTVYQGQLDPLPKALFSVLQKPA